MLLDHFPKLKLIIFWLELADNLVRARIIS